MSVIVTDHAIVRWLERVTGCDIDAVRAEIASHVPDGFTDGNIKTGDGHRLGLREGVVCTVMPKRAVQRVSATIRKRGQRQERSGR